MDNLSQSSGGQFRPIIPAQPGQSFMTSAAQPFQLAGQNMSSSNVGMPASQIQPLQYPQSLPQLLPRPSHPSFAPSSQAMQMPYVQTRPLSSVPPQSQQNVPAPNHHMHGLGAQGLPLSSPYTFQPLSQMHAPVAVGHHNQPWLSSGSQTTTLVSPVEQANQHSSVTSAVNVPVLSQQSSSDWQEHTSADGRRYYYNKKTKQSSWEKPLELMTPLERADASTVWKEFTAPDGRKYYYNKVTKESKWTMPEELKLAREQAQKEAVHGMPSDAVVTTAVSTPSVGHSYAETPAVTSANTSVTLTVSGVTSSPVSVTPFVSVSSSSSVVVSGGTQIAASTSVTGAQPSVVTVASQSVPSSGGVVPPAVVHANAASVRPGFESLASQDVTNSVDGTSTEDIEEARKGMAVAGKVNEIVLEEKTVDEEPLVFANKQEAKNAFKALLESVNVQSDWTWEQAMREIINDKRYGALKTLGERKQAFHEYLGHRKKMDAEERRVRQKKAREEFTKMLEESKELMSSTRWSKAVSMFENDERFKAVERARDREDLFESYIVELERKEKERAAEEHRKNIAEYRKFLESCDYIKVSSQWRKVQDRLEDDERCSCLEKLDRLLIFQDYIRDLEKEEEDQKKIHKERVRRIERKNRDEFRKLMEEHVTAGILTAKTLWRDYCLEVKDLPQYQAVALNLSGSTPKDLFEDVVEELENKYHEEKGQIKDVMKAEKITITSSWTFDDFKAAIEDGGCLTVSDINMKLVYEDLLERAIEKEEKEAKRRQRLADDFSRLLQTFKEITTSSDWEDSKQLFEESEEYRSIGEESFAREVFEEYIMHLQEKAKEKERKREEEKAKKEREREEKEKRKEKERKEKEKEKERGEREKEKGRLKKDETDSENVDMSETPGHKEDKKREKDRDRKHRKRHHSATDDGGSDKDEREESKKSRKHGSDRKKSRKHAYTPESDSESRHRRHKRDRDSTRRSGYDELEDGELGEDGEIQ